MFPPINPFGPGNLFGQSSQPQLPTSGGQDWTDDEWVDDNEWVDDDPWYKKAYNYVADPLFNTFINAAKERKLVAEKYIRENEITNPLVRGYQQLASGVDEFTARLASPSILDVADIGLGMGGGALARKGLTTIGRGMEMGSKVLGAPVAAHGLGEMFGSDRTMSQRAMGGVEALGGAAGMWSPLTPKPGSVTPDVDIDTLLKEIQFDVEQPNVGGMGSVIPPPKPGNIPPPVGPTGRPQPTIPPGWQTVNKTIPGFVPPPQTVPSTTIPPNVPIPPPVGPTVPPVTQGQVGAQLPSHLRGAQPRYNFGATSFIPQFEDDLDKALFIIAQPVPSKANDEYLKFVMDQTGMSKVEAMSAAQDIRTAIKAQASKTAVPGPIDIKSIFRQSQDPALRKARQTIMNYNSVYDLTGKTNQEILDLAEAIDPNINEAIVARGLKMGVGNPADAIRIVANSYAGAPPQVAGKELLQNAIDATATVPNGQVSIDFDFRDGTLQVTDNGPGLTLKQIETVYINLTESGKRGGDVPTIGEMGVGKVTYLVSGEYVKVTTVAREADGSLMKYEFQGTPDDFITNKFDVEGNPVPEGTPTGTIVDLKLPNDSNFHALEAYLKHLKKYSNVPVPITSRSKWYNPQNPPGSDPHLEIIDIPANSNAGWNKGRTLSQFDIPGSNVKLSIPDDAEIGETDTIALILVNRGMFQSVDAVGFGGKYKLPDRILVELDPNVIATDKKYPLISPTRERLNDSARQEIKKVIDDILVKGEREKKAAQLDRLFEGLTPPPGRKITVVDQFGKYTPEEIEEIYNSPELNRIWDVLAPELEKLMDMFNYRAIANLKGYGWILNEKVRGMNVRRPLNRADNYVLLNPITILRSGDNNVEEAASAFVHIMVHEFAHIKVKNEGSDLTSEIANILTKYNLRMQNEAAKPIVDILAGRPFTGSNIKYSPKIQELLQRNEVIAGRQAVGENPLLAQEGSRADVPGGQGQVPLGNQPNGARAIGDQPEGTVIRIRKTGVRPENIQQVIAAGYELIDDSGDYFRFRRGGSGQPPILEQDVASAMSAGPLGPQIDVQKPSKLQEAFNLPRGLMASMDFSAPLRQGLPLIMKGAFWKALVPMFRSWTTEAGFKASQDAIKARSLFIDRMGPGGKIQPSFAKKSGLYLAELTDINKREEIIASTWAEKFPGVRRSNRAYTAFLNNLRADTFEQLIKNGKLIQPNLPVDMVTSRALANFVNIATGRGSLGSLEPAAKLLGNTFFSPRLIASRVQMLNPAYYIMAPKQVRNEALKSLFAIAAVGNIFNALGAMAGGSVSLDPSNSDFMKLKIGDTRIDPWGGFQQYFVAANRLLNPMGPVTGFAGDNPFTRGQMRTSSTTGAQYDLWEPSPGPFDPNSATVAGDFIRGKMHPVLGFAWSLFSGREEMSGEKMNMTTMNPMKNAIAQRFVPILMQDLYELSQADQLPPELKGIIGGLSAFGMGSQTYEPKQR